MLAAALLFSTGGAAIKGTVLTAWQVASFRSGVAALALLVLLPGARRAWRHGWGMVGVGAAYGATLVLFVVGNKLTTAANTIFLQSTAPLYVLALSPWLLGERARRRDLGYMAALAVGLAMFFVGERQPDALAPDPLTGNLLAATAGVTWGLTLLGLRALGRRDDAHETGNEAGIEAGNRAGIEAGNRAGIEAGNESDIGAAPAGPATAGRRRAAPAGGAGAAAVFVGNLFAFLVCLPMALPVVAGEGGTVSGAGSAAVAAPGLADLWIVLFLGVFQIAVAYVFLTRALRRVAALEASLLLLVEPVLNPVWAWLVHGEEPGAWAMAGGGVIVAATVVKSWLDARRAGARPTAAG